MSPVSPAFHLDEGTLSAGHHLDRSSDEFLRNVDGQHLYRLAALASDHLVQHLRLADLKFETLAAHGLDKHRKMENSTSVDNE